MNLSRNLILDLYNSEDPFPIDFDDAWQWIGYSEKRAALKVLKNNFSENVDFLYKGTKSKTGGRPSEWVTLTVDCFKSLAMMAGTAKGREVRLYFLKCEKELQQRLQAEQKTQRQRVVRAIVSDQHSAWKKRFEDEFFEETYRITGWKRPSKGHPPCMGGFINKNVYDLFPEGVSERLREVNPKNENGNRPQRHHQHLTKNVGHPLLEYQKGITIAVMRLSPDNNKERFKQNMHRACGGSFQVELPFMDDDSLAS